MLFFIAVPFRLLLIFLLVLLHVNLISLFLSIMNNSLLLFRLYVSASIHIDSISFSTFFLWYCDVCNICTWPWQPWFHLFRMLKPAFIDRYTFSLGMVNNTLCIVNGRIRGGWYVNEILLLFWLFFIWKLFHNFTVGNEISV